jgi:integrase
MARQPSQPVLDGHGNRIKGLSYRETARSGRVYESVVYDHGSSPRRVPLAAKTQKDATAEHKALQLAEQIRKARPSTQPRKRLTLSEAAERYFTATEGFIARAETEGIPDDYKGVTSIDTLNGYRTNWLNWIEPWFRGRTQCREVTTASCQEFFAHLRRQPGRTGKTLAEGTINSVKSALSAILEEARVAGGLDTDPLAGLSKRDRPKTKPRKSYRKVAVRPEVLYAIFENAARGYKKALVAMAVFTGMRAGEIVALKWEDLRFDEAQPYVWIAHSLARDGSRKGTKTGKERPFPLNPETVEALQAHRETERERGLGRDDDYVFTRPFARGGFGKPVGRRVVLDAVVDACEGLGLADGKGEPIASIDVRAARRSVATWLANEPSLPRNVAAGQMGHSVETAEREYVQRHHDAQEIEMVGMVIRRPTLTVIEGGQAQTA